MTSSERSKEATLVNVFLVNIENRRWAPRSKTYLVVRLFCIARAFWPRSRECIVDMLAGSQVKSQHCQIRAKCVRYKDAKRRHLSYYADASGENISHAMIKKIETEKGRKIYPRRIAIAEPVFANIRVQKRMDKFNLRGKIKVNIQWLLYCMVHNIEKIANYGFA